MPQSPQIEVSIQLKSEVATPSAFKDRMGHKVLDIRTHYVHISSSRYEVKKPRARSIHFLRDKRSLIKRASR